MPVPPKSVARFVMSDASSGFSRSAMNVLRRNVSSPALPARKSFARLWLTSNVSFWPPPIA